MLSMLRTLMVVVSFGSRFILIVPLIVVACQEQVAPAASSATDHPPTLIDESPTAVDIANATETDVTPATAISLATGTATPGPDGETYTPRVITVAADHGVPEPIVAALKGVVSAHPNEFSWVPADADAVLKAKYDTPLFTWIVAVAVPFATVQDDISGEALRAAWRAGALTMDQETADVLRSRWDAPERPPTLVESEMVADTLWQRHGAEDVPALGIVPFEQLVPQLKVLDVDGVSPVAPDFQVADYGLGFTYGLAGDADSVSAIFAKWSLVFGGPLPSNRDERRMTHVAMTGPAGMRRAVADRMERYGMNYPAEETGPILQAVDIAHMSNENAFAADCPMPDPNDSANICNRDAYIALMDWMSIDVNELTGNHLNDWGSQALLHTLDMYETFAIDTFGGGRDLEDARRPLLIEDSGNRIAFVGCNPVGPPHGWAAEAYPGSLPCDDFSAIREQIAALDGAGYLVIATLQYAEEYHYDVSEEQRQLFESLAEAGATVVSGSHAHHPQGFSLTTGGFIHYGLGNLLADQMWSLGSRQMFIDSYLFYEGRLLNVTLWTGINEDYARVRQMTPDERADLLRAVFAESHW